VIVQYVPFESPLAVARFLRHWRPQVGLFMESPAWPILVEGAAAAGVRLGLLNARMSSSSFLKWFMRSMSRALLSRLLSHFSLIVPQSDVVRRGGRGGGGCLAAWEGPWAGEGPGVACQDVFTYEALVLLG
jgi:3-deoxy-D-manno-octulosonic-acid transferase